MSSLTFVSRMVTKRLAAAVLVVWLVSIFVFSLVHLVPGDPAVAVAGEGATAERIDQIRTELGLDRPLVVQYWDWLSRALHGDLGRSLTTGEPVLDGLLTRVPATISLTVAALAVAMLIGLPAGIVAGLRPGTWLDRVASSLATLGVATPSFWLGSVLVMTFALGLGWFEPIGYTPWTESPLGWLRSMTLPAIALGTAGAAELARQTRAGIIAVSQREYVRTAIAYGLSSRTIVTRHVLRNAAIPIVTVLGIKVATLLAGSVVIESLFAIDGVGRYGADAVIARNFPVVQGMVLLVAITVVVLNLVVDVAYIFINPRMRGGQ